ncbi:sporulation protein YjcZ [Bacillus toyonensis]|nr:YjcZ family sporulation protein [Bacillus toyonensis]PEP77618.1 sporulation protein YjcZ [Bacillus toyonensis]
MGFGDSCGSCGGGFALLVVLFILLSIFISFIKDIE